MLLQNSLTLCCIISPAAAQAGPPPIPPYRDYFKAKSIREIILNYEYKTHLTKREREEEYSQRLALLHFLECTLQWDPDKRWIPHELILHPFVTGQPWTGGFERPTLPSLPRRLNLFGPPSTPSTPTSTPVRSFFLRYLFCMIFCLPFFKFSFSFLYNLQLTIFGIYCTHILTCNSFDYRLGLSNKH